MKRTSIFGMAAVVALALLAWSLYSIGTEAQKVPGGQRPQGAAPPVAPAVCGQMNIVPSQNVGNNNNVLNGVTALSSSDALAVGYSYTGSVFQTLVEHWNGSAWSTVASPNPGSTSNQLTGVSALSNNDAWAVGHYSNGDTPQTLVEHWNGSAWSVVPSPNLGTSNNDLYGVSALASNDVWAVGNYIGATVFETLVEHWDGSAWSVVNSPNAGTSSNQLTAVSALASNDAWAVGYYYPSINGVLQTLVEHWDGTAWSVVSSPNVGSHDNALNGISMLASNDAWTVGGYNNGSGLNQTLVEHWNGSTWSVVTSQNPGTSSNLLGVSALASNDAWAIGGYDNGSGTYQTLVEHWNGTAWSVVPSQNSGSGDNFLHGVSALPGGDVWAVGDYGTPGQTLVEKYGGPCPVTTATPTVTPGSCTFSFSPSPNVGTGDNKLRAVSALTANDVWAVGYDNNGSYDRALAEHWDGAAWSVVSSPNPGTGNSNLQGVSALASNDVWAIGGYDNGGAGQTLVEHWNGAAWSVLPSPNPGSVNNYLLGVSALASNDVWAIGYSNNGSANQTLVVHWNGTSWEAVSSPNPGSVSNNLTGVSALASNDVWAVGAYVTGSNVPQTLAEHWNGSAWSVVPSPNISGSSNYLRGVSALASNDVWAVGYSSYSGSQTLVEHWNGTAWSVVPSPNVGYGGDELYGVSARVSNDVWAVGEYYGGFGYHQTLVEHWNGSAWLVVPSSNVSYNNDLYGVSALPNGDVWAVGRYGTPEQTLVERYAGQCSLPTPTPAASPTPCTAGVFSDVHPSDYFYTPVSYLASHGVISGYSDCTFRPYANTTRSQMVKIVILGFNKAAVTPAGSNYSFADVPRSNPFFPVVETAYADGIVSGYTCGIAPAGACDAQNRPYFLPYANVTRAQLSKIDVIAAGWTLYNPAMPTFSDVAHGSTFYSVIETAVCHGVISGYADHTFRPFNNATRGQISKIVYLSIVNPPTNCGP